MMKRMTLALGAAVALSLPPIAQVRPLLNEGATTQIAVDQARVDLVNARYDYVLARAQLEAILGRNL